VRAGAACGDPLLPDRVYRREIGHAREVDRRRQDPRLVAAGFGQERVDLRQHLLRLPGDVGFRVVRNLARKVRCARRTIDHELGEALADMAAFDRHGAILSVALPAGRPQHCSPR
jgi:hypothetical protein